jgi:hypothetical protein
MRPIPKSRNVDGSGLTVGAASVGEIERVAPATFERPKRFRCMGNVGMPCSRLLVCPSAYRWIARIPIFRLSKSVTNTEQKTLPMFLSSQGEWMALAVPVVQEVSLEVGVVAALTQDQALMKAALYIKTISADAQAISVFLNAHSASLVPDILHAVAVFAATAKIPELAKLASRDLDTVIQMAYGAARSTE